MGDIVKAESDSYEAILNEYSQKLKEATPILINKYNDSAKTTQGGLQGLATLCNDKISDLADILLDGMGKMSDVHYYRGSGSYEEYKEWASKLYIVYEEEASKIQDVYTKSAQ